MEASWATDATVLETRGAFLPATRTSGRWSKSIISSVWLGISRERFSRIAWATVGRKTTPESSAGAPPFPRTKLSIEDRIPASEPSPGAPADPAQSKASIVRRIRPSLTGRRASLPSSPPLPSSSYSTQVSIQRPSRRSTRSWARLSRTSSPRTYTWPPPHDLPRSRHASRLAASAATEENRCAWPSPPRRATRSRCLYCGWRARQPCVDRSTDRQALSLSLSLSLSLTSRTGTRRRPRRCTPWFRTPAGHFSRRNPSRRPPAFRSLRRSRRS